MGALETALLRTAAATMDGLAIIADAARRDIEATGIPAPNLRLAAGQYRDEAARIRTTNDD